MAEYYTLTFSELKAAIGRSAAIMRVRLYCGDVFREIGCVRDGRLLGSLSAEQLEYGLNNPAGVSDIVKSAISE